MPITKGALKAHKASLNKRVFNLRRKNTMVDTVKKVKKLIASGDVAEATKLMPTAQKAIDKAEKRGVIKPNTASRKIARLAAAMKSIVAK